MPAARNWTPSRLSWRRSRPGTARRTGGAAGVLPGYRRAAQPGPDRRGRRLAPVPVRASLHGLYRPWCPASTPGGDKTRRGPVTKAGSEPVRTALVEAAWAYRFKPAIGVTLRCPQRDAELGTLARSWLLERFFLTAQVRNCKNRHFDPST